VINVARDYLQQGQFSTGLMDADLLSSSDLVSAARAGDPLALAVIDRCATWLGILLANCAATLNPERIVIGGGFGRTTFDLLIPGAKAEMKRRTHSVSHSQLDIVPSALLSSAVGAACIVWQHLAS
jgi:glucokinase